MKFPRSAGILLHPTSLPGAYGIGDLGTEALRFCSYLKDSGIKIWQVLPLNPTGYGDSPYQSLSAFAGNPLLISLETLAAEGLLDKQALHPMPDFPEGHVDFSMVIPWKFNLLRKASSNFFGSSACKQKADFENFTHQNHAWLDDYALFMAAKDAHEGRVWTEWDPDLASRQHAAIAKWSEKLSSEITAYKFWQYEFFRQWNAIQEDCARRGIRIMGDIPIYAAHDSADVWAHPEMFWLDEKGNPLKVSGVPPDYFSATGQLWGNPLYRWDVMRATSYRWWIERLRASLKMFDMVRLDHFRGFEAYWEIPAGEPTAMHGKWVKGPGGELFQVLTDALGPLPIVAENLGVITPEVEAIRKRFDYPGMAILQFAFSTDPQAPTFRPHNYEQQLVAYTGGHDNDTMFGWWHSGVAQSTRTQADVKKEYAEAQNYFGFSANEFDREVNWIFIREVMKSVANTVLFPMQDVLGLGSEARMNTPGTLGGNWTWRLGANSLREADQSRLKLLAEIFER
ncbi:MAG TPA: 4-alpha-glucanotransferase [Candidatus Polarisedimenticolia bacterium]|nr:4-alpha-glucanotransferase [Candidatus Polarisedimenticolia bacterium]